MYSQFLPKFKNLSELVELKRVPSIFIPIELNIFVMRLADFFFMTQSQPVFYDKIFISRKATMWEFLKKKSKKRQHLVDSCHKSTFCQRYTNINAFCYCFIDLLFVTNFSKKNYQSTYSIVCVSIFFFNARVLYNVRKFIIPLEVSAVLNNP